ncbi:cyclic GMP-AMP synthase DncV-like nucleotidyltransferase [Pseudomonas sp. Pseusp122]|uniref:SMODS domain-containing nucleotidyltransferase n=1 Tax=unclassified Pseudomonas TaxID=196821 RepID=UPI0039A429D2
MTQTDLFNNFLSDTVNLNKTRFENLQSSITAIENFVRSSDWQPNILEFKAQGSWAHKTIIKPIAGSAFDADLLVYVDHLDNWEAKDYLDKLYTEFKKSSTYQDKVSKYSHCITIDYAGERKIDIAPCVKERNLTNTYEVCNRTTNSFEKSNPKEYTDWLILQNKNSKNNNLRKITRLLKYMRDIKRTFTCPSFLLTTLLGKQINEHDSFPNLPSALVTVVGRLDNWLQSNLIQPTVRNPVLFEEVQSNSWDADKYRNFRETIHRYREWMDDAFAEADIDESMSKWRRVFGEEFAKAEISKAAARISVTACESLAAEGRHAIDLVEGVLTYGEIALPAGFTNLGHMQRPKWRDAPGGMLTVRILTYEFTAHEGLSLGNTLSLAPHTAGRWLKFSALSGNGIPFSSAHKIKWRITNTDKAAEAAQSLRGDFYPSNSHGIRWEQLSYRGVHIVEAFLIRRSDDRLCGKSDPFFVVIT